MAQFPSLRFTEAGMLAMCSACIKKHTGAQSRTLVSVLVETIDYSAAALLFVLFLQLLKKKKKIYLLL